MDDLAIRYKDVDPDGAIGGYEVTYSNVNGIRTRYYDIGQGEPIVLLHGGSWEGAASANTWVPVFDGLSESFRVIAPDRLANGMTDNPTDEENFVYDSEVDHMASFLDEMSLDTIHLVGQSRGGGLAGALATEIPDRVESLVIVNSGTLAPEWGDYAFRRNRIHRNEPADASSSSYYRDKIHHFYELVSYATDHITEEYISTAAYMRERPKAMKTAAVMADGARERWDKSINEHMAETRRRIEVDGLDIPTLIYWGRNDPTSVIGQGHSLYELFAQKTPIVRMYTVDKAGHHPYREYPMEFARIVTTFIKQWTKEVDIPGRECSEDGTPGWYDSKDT